MPHDTLRYGFLEAGTKSALVVLDARLNTGQPDTVYVYNHQRGAILEYKRAILEPKLRDLTPDELEQVKSLRSAYRKARTGFTPRGARVAQALEKTRSTPPPQPAAPEMVFEGLDSAFGDDESEPELDDDSEAA